MGKAKQITVWVENRAGQLARITKALAQSKVNLIALATYDTENGSAIRVVAANPARARQALDGLGLRLSEEDVLRLSLAHRPGQLAKVSARLAEENITVTYAYGVAGTGSKNAEFVLAVSDLVGAMKALKGLQV